MWTIMLKLLKKKRFKAKSQNKLGMIIFFYFIATPGVLRGCMFTELLLSLLKAVKSDVMSWHALLEHANSA